LPSSLKRPNGSLGGGGGQKRERGGISDRKREPENPTMCL